MMPEDIFRHISSAEKHDTFYIVGSSPLGANHIHRIPGGAPTICVNAAVRYERTFDYWMAFDTGMLMYDWVPNLYLSRRTLTVWGEKLAHTYLNSPIYSDAIPLHYTFRHTPVVQAEHIKRLIKQGRWTSPLHEGSLRGGMNIVGCALQLATWLGATTIGMLGVEMRGGGHFDGSFNHSPGSAGRWGVTDKLNWLCETLKRNHGVNVYSLHDTLIKIPVVADE